MIKITMALAKELAKIKNVGHTSEFGAVVGDSEFIIYYKDNDKQPYLAHISEFEVSGVCIRLKEKEKNEK